MSYVFYENKKRMENESFYVKFYKKNYIVSS